MDKPKYKCIFCGKEIYWFERATTSDYIACLDCYDKIHTDPVFKRHCMEKLAIDREHAIKAEREAVIKQKVTNIFNKIAFVFFQIFIVLLIFAFIIFLIGGCIGNALNLGEDPPAGLHWKYDKP